MRLIFIRHAEPDYEHDSVTEKGEREARLLAERLAREKVDGVYISPLGRAQRTAQAYLKKVDGQGETCDWLQDAIGCRNLRRASAIPAQKICGASGIFSRPSSNNIRSCIPQASG